MLLIQNNSSLENFARDEEAYKKFSKDVKRIIKEILKKEERRQKEEEKETK
ncbi:hypothetical protein [Mycoplasma suis]|uniref:hypothetical protein n=1 Tax=Mycoplasma suis TaxID=57372 RepID=UPI0002FB4965|nr:hypothetical protein [Mycoplasma suis]